MYWINFEIPQKSFDFTKIQISQVKMDPKNVFIFIQLLELF